AYNGMMLPLQISVQDDGRINNVELYYRTDNENWQKAFTSLVKGSSKNGIYEAYIQPEDVVDSLEYKWEISDYGGNETISDIFEPSIEEGITIGYEADFESDPHWLKSGVNNSWERGIPTYGPDNAVSG